MSKCKICGYQPPCPRCGCYPDGDQEPTEEQLKREATDEAEHEHYRNEHYRKAYYEEQGWKFTPKSFVPPGQQGGIIECQESE